MPRQFSLALMFPILISLILVLGACGGSGSDQNSSAATVDGAVPGSLTMDEAQHEAWEISLVEMRIEKNEAFADPRRTPLPTAALEDFEGLNYYLPVPEMRFRTPFLAEAGADTVLLTKRAGQEVPYIKRGTVRFRWRDEDHSLDVFGPVSPQGEDYLWLPFFDATSGQETYGGGRYLDIEVDEEGMVDLDFNFCYNPLCDYNAERYNCTLPPVGNTLPFPVNAGEKAFSQDP
ncbi:hypothetical protein CSB20_07340 [bacterium DOLZORAL124_64_63]|nr:MAG: hypothetical protein CSB20_07340 [bacterium DOLZORAL124_64_63]